MRLLQLVIEQFDDLNLTENFKRIVDYVQFHSLLHGFKFVDVTFTEAVTGYKIKHGFGAIPLDVVVLQGGEFVTPTFASFTSTDIVVTVTGACRFRAFVGSYSSDR